MGKKEQNLNQYNPPFYLHKVNNYQKAVYERKGHWTEKEKVKYGVFLEIYRDKFEDRQNPILNKMFRVMSDFIKTRNHNQCRSHHQKMEREKFEIDSILESIRSKYHPRDYELFFEKYSKHIITINIQSVLNEKGFTPHRNVEKRKRKHLTKSEEISKVSFMINQIKRDGEDEPQNNKNFQNLQDEIQFGKGVQQEQKKQNKKTVEIQNFNVVEKNSAMKQDNQIQQIESKVELKEEKQIDIKDAKELKKTGLEYESDSQDVNERSEVAYVQIPSEALLMGQNNFMPGSVNMNLVSQINQHPIMNSTHFAIDSFSVFQKNQSRLNQSIPMSINQFGFQQNYERSLKQLDQKKKWHLNEASRLCTSMYQHIQQANLCQQMKEAYLKEMMNFRQQFYYSSGHFTNSHY